VIEDRRTDLASATDHQDHDTPNLSGDPSGRNEVGAPKYSGEEEARRFLPRLGSRVDEARLSTTSEMGHDRDDERGTW